MKWVTLLCLFLFSITVDSRHLQKRHHEEEHDSIGKLKKTVGDEKFGYITLVLVSQYLEKCTVEEHLKLVPEIVAFAQHCEDHEEDEKCKKPPIEIFLEKICEHKHLEAGYPWMHDCCAKEGKEEVECFDKHKDTEVEVYKIPDPEEACKHHKENPEFSYKHTVTEISRRHSSLSPPIVLGFAKQYHTMTSECCEAEEKAKCFAERMPEIKKSTDYIEAKLKHQCNVLKIFPERATQAITLAKLSQKYPNAEFSVLAKITQETVHMKKDCCEHDSVECMTDKLHLVDHVCHDKEKLSSKLDACCEKPILARSACIHELPNGETPADLPSLLTEFVENNHVCKDYEADKTGFLSKLLYEYSRRHTHDHYLQCVRVAKGYEEAIEKCCATANPPECYKVVEKLLEEAIEKSNKFAKENCEKVKESADNYILGKVVTYAKRIPQLRDEGIIKIGYKMYKTAEYCCAQPEDKIKYCGEEKLNLIYGKICEAASSLNDQVKHCCTDSYANRRLCFIGLGADPSYHPPALDDSAFHIGDNICKGSDEEKHSHKLELLIKMVKQKPDLKKEELAPIVKHFREMVQICCPEAEPKECLDKESPAIIAEVKKVLEH